MILSDRDIKAEIATGKLKVENMSDPALQIQPSGIDIRLGNEFRIFKSISIPYIDPRNPVENYTESIQIEDDKPFILHPGEFVLASTKEYIGMPTHLVGILDGRSSLGRLGVTVHTTASGINPGWEGRITLEVTNIGKIPIALYPGMRIAKLTFARLTSEPDIPYGKRGNEKYQKQTGLDESKLHEEF